MAENGIKVGVIGGTGFRDLIGFEELSSRDVPTPYGIASDMLTEGFISGVPCALISRHGRTHSISPSNVNYRANIWALKSIGCTHILAITSCGSLQNEIKPGDVLVLDQFFDRTHQRNQTFYDGKPESLKGIMHIPMKEPFCERTRQILIEASKMVTDRVHSTGTVVTIEGGRFSSKFESKYFHQLGLSVINMTTVPEVMLAKELGLCYASLAMVTDYDSWREDVDGVDAASVISMAKSNSRIGEEIVVNAIILAAKQDWTDVIKKNMELLESSKIERR